MHGHRRRKKRPNYGIRSVEVNRGLNGFGFTISGQQPCILSCIVANSPADQAGLRAGDFLISVNGMNVSRLPHEAVVQLIGNTYGAIKMAIAENYYSDSSDEDILFQGSQQRSRPKYPHHKTKCNRSTVMGKQPNSLGNVATSTPADLVVTCEEAASIVVNDSPTAYNVILSPNASSSCDISNVSAMVRLVQLSQDQNDVHAGPSQSQSTGQEIALEYKAVVGYLGTIEMPKQIATSSKLQTVRSCIRKMRQEKRNPTTVLMTILPSCLNLINTSNAIIAKYSSVRLSYVSSSSENDNRYFGLVTSAIYADGLMCENSDILNQRKDVVISNSCHVFVIDSKLIEHAAHFEKAELLKIICTKDPITNLCLEFPGSSEYVVNLIRSMYNLKAPIKPECPTAGKPPVARSLNLDHAVRAYPRVLNDPRLNPRAMEDPHDMLASNSPQPSNHSEITTTSSNSDSGIGFHNDCRNISDRILVVDFPGIPNHQQISNVRAHFRKSHPFGLSGRPVGIINGLPPKLDPIRNIRSTTRPEVVPQIYHGKSKSADYSYSLSAGIDRLTVRARPDPKSFISDRSPSKDNALNNMNDQSSAKYERIYPDHPGNQAADSNWAVGKTVDDQGNVVQERPVDVPQLKEVINDLERYNSDNVKNSLLAARSCDDMILSLEKESFEPKVQLSVDDLTLVEKQSQVEKEHVFLQPTKPIKRSKKVCAHKSSGKQSCTGADDTSVESSSNRSSQHGGDKLMSYKLSPKVFGLARPMSMSVENISSAITVVSGFDGEKSRKDETEGSGGERRNKSVKRLSGGFSAIWGSLQELRSGGKHDDSVAIMERSTKGARKGQERHSSGLKVIEGTYSEPDLRFDEGKQINHNASPFRRWGQSSLRSRSGDQRTPGSAHRRPSSLAASESDVYTKSIDDDYSSTKSGYNPYADAASTVTTDSTQTSAGGTGGSTTGPAGVASWGTTFEKLLEDAAGLHTFSEFLKKEFSAENIYFWTACERYRQLADRDERAKEAQAIFAKHLESGCSEPVNVDSIARNIAQENLPQAEQTLFAAAQKQIFNLMKFDSYQRFIKSDMYRTCQDAEAKGHPLPYPGEQLDPLLRTSFVVQATSKLKKSLSNAEDRRRKSLLPWHRKTRCKSKDRGDSELKKESGKSSLSNGGGTGGSSNTLKVLSTNSASDIHSSRSSLASFDAAIGKSYDLDDNRNTLCRVILSNGATTVVQTRSNETIKELVERLLEKRGIVYNAYEAFLAGNHKPLDLDGPSSSLAGKEVNIDQRVVFKLSLPNRKMISVKSKATKPLGDVLRPILLKYNYELDQMNVYSKDAYLDMSYPVTSVDGLWLQVRNGNENEFHQDLTRTIASRSERSQSNQAPSLPIIATSQHQQIINHFQQQLHYQQAQSQPQSFVMPAPVNNIAKKQTPTAYNAQAHNYSNSINNNNNNNQLMKSKEELKDDNKQELNMLDEITNKVFNELMNGKIANGKIPEDCTSDSSSTRRDRFRRRGSNAPSESGRGAKSKKCSTGGSEDGGDSVNNGAGSKKPIIAKLKAGVKLQIPTRSQNDELLEGLKRAQRSRLEDQRGTEINFELPDFLKDKENFTSGGSGNCASGTATSAGGALSSKFVRKLGKRSDYMTSSSLEFPLSTSTTGGSLQQINKPLPAPRLSIASSRSLATAGGCGGSPTSPCGPVHSASSESNLNNLSIRCNPSPLTLDDNGNGSQSENSYADNALVFTQGAASPNLSPSSHTIHQATNFHLPSLSNHGELGHDSTVISGTHSGKDCCNDGSSHHRHHHHHHHHPAATHGGSSGHHHHHHYHHHHHNFSASTTSESGSSSSGSSSSGSSSSSSSDGDHQKGPPPLPPKPKILPIKPSNWGHTTASSLGSSSSGSNHISTSLCNLPSAASSGNSGGHGGSQKGVSGSTNNHNSNKERRLSGQPQQQEQHTQKQSQQQTSRSVYLDHASSSFV